MAEEYISKQAFNDAIREAIRRYPSTFYNGLETARQIAHNLPAADVAPVRHGRWMECKPYNPEFNGYECSECGAKYQGFHPDNYCPNCGAQMDGGKT